MTLGNYFKHTNKVLFFVIAVVFSQVVAAQQMNWQNLDLNQDGIFGVSTERAYHDLLKGKNSRSVIVAIVDSGIDTLHEDLKNVLWNDPATGRHGWNYIGTESGQEDITKLVSTKKSFYDSLTYTIVPEIYREGYQAYRKLAPELDRKLKQMNYMIASLKAAIEISDSILQRLDTNDPSLEDFIHYHPYNSNEKIICTLIIKRWPFYSNWKDLKFHEMTQILDAATYHVRHGLNISNSEEDTAKGSADVNPDALGIIEDTNPTALHGTHVAGIIGAVRNNGIGMNGVADNAKIMALKTVGNIRELRDKSLANAIVFAVDHGAKVINLSFGKPYTWDKKCVDDAVKYAMQKDVLLIHAAGNSGTDLDANEHYPNPNYLDKGTAKAWIEVGASGPNDDHTLLPDFSNYGQTAVDVFAPGVQIYSTLPGNQYAKWNGTSMAAPVVSGLAALIREYYPKLSAIQVKEIIMKSVVKRDILKDKCMSGGVVNAYNALQLAAAYK